MDAFFTKETAKFLTKTTPCDNGECVLWTGYCNKKGYGMARIKDSDDKWMTLTAHRLCILLQRKSFNLGNLDASHICHNSKCVNHKHIVLEPHHINNNRITCVARGECFGHLDSPACRLDLKLVPFTET